MNFCSNCGAPVSRKVPPGDHLPRFVCDACQAIHYENPKIVVGCIPEWEDQILLCRRAIEPKYGLWTVPAGFMEQGETAEQAAAREALEEAQVDVEITSLYAVFSIPHISQVYVIFRGRMRTPPRTRWPSLSLTKPCTATSRTEAGAASRSTPEWCRQSVNEMRNPGKE